MSSAQKFFFFNDTATTEIYTLSLHDALPISTRAHDADEIAARHLEVDPVHGSNDHTVVGELLPQVRRSEEHTSELQSRQYLVCRLLLEKKDRIVHAHLQVFHCTNTLFNPSSA